MLLNQLAAPGCLLLLKRKQATSASVYITENRTSAQLRCLSTSTRLPDEVQDWLAGSTIFSTLDMQNGHWQLPVNPSDKEKTAFCHGPRMELFQFNRMPFGLTGAPSSFQRFMDKIFQGLSYRYILTISLYIPPMKKLIRPICKKYSLDCQRLDSP